MPRSSRRRAAAENSSSFSLSLPSRHAMNRKAGRILFRVLAVELAIEQLELLDLRYRLHADLLHRLEIQILAQDFFHDALVIRRLFDHSPAPELAQPPHPESLLRIVAAPVREDHVV